MAVKIRLFRAGGKKNPFYRIVVANSESPRDGKFIEILGHYDPAKGLESSKLNVEGYKEWLKKGATPTEIVEKIAKKLNA
ncbi:MAG: 30S ribosomal protein S16 [bacterium]